MPDMLSCFFLQIFLWYHGGHIAITQFLREVKEVKEVKVVSNHGFVFSICGLFDYASGLVCSAIPPVMEKAMSKSTYELIECYQQIQVMEKWN